MSDKLFLYLITQTKRQDYDTYVGAVVAAVNETEAKAIHPRGFGKPITNETSESDLDDWAKPKFVTARLIGTALNVKRGVVLAAFRAG